MIYIVSLVAGLIVGKFTGGRISNLLNIRLKCIGIILTAFLLQIVLRFIYINYLVFDNSLALVLANLAIYILLGTGFWLNRHYIGMCIIGFGMLLNSLVILHNGGKMPVDIRLMEGYVPVEAIDLLRSGRDPAHSVITDETLLAFLADIIRLPAFLKTFNLVVSIGDLLIAFGIFMLFFELMRGGFNLKFLGRFSTGINQ